MPSSADGDAAAGDFELWCAGLVLASAFAGKGGIGLACSAAKWGALIASISPQAASRKPLQGAAAQGKSPLSGHDDTVAASGGGSSCEYAYAASRSAAAVEAAIALVHVPGTRTVAHNGVLRAILENNAGAEAGDSKTLERECSGSGASAGGVPISLHESASAPLLLAVQLAKGKHAAVQMFHSSHLADSVIRRLKDGVVSNDPQTIAACVACLVSLLALPSAPAGSAFMYA